MHAERILINATLVNRLGEEKKEQALAILGEKIIWSGAMAKLPSLLAHHQTIIEDCHNGLITPGLIDCHTHLVYAGNRANELRLKAEGTSYAEIARLGGGILSTVEKTRKASEDELLEESWPRLLALVREGVTTVEIKSGYGLDLKTELKILKVARRLGQCMNLHIKTTFLGAHTLPKEYSNKSQDYVDYLCQEMLPAVAAEKLADAVDVYCERGAFTLAQTEQIFQAANDLHLHIKCHADQFSNLGASSLAAKMKALSCDHLEYAEEKDAEMLGKTGTVAVLLPGAFYFLGEQKVPPIALLRKHKVKMAIATDANPGTSPTTSLQLMMSMALHFFKLTIPEIIMGVTTHAAAALGIDEERGSLEQGMIADLNYWPLSDSASLCYHFGYPLAHKTMIKGRWLSQEQTCPP